MMKHKKIITNFYNKNHAMLRHYINKQLNKKGGMKVNDKYR